MNRTYLELGTFSFGNLIYWMAKILIGVIDLSLYLFCSHPFIPSLLLINYSLTDPFLPSAGVGVFFVDDGGC